MNRHAHRLIVNALVFVVVFTVIACILAFTGCTGPQLVGATTTFTYTRGATATQPSESMTWTNPKGMTVKGLKFSPNPLTISIDSLKSDEVETIKAQLEALKLQYPFLTATIEGILSKLP